MRIENRRRNKNQGVNITAADVKHGTIGRRKVAILPLYVLVAKDTLGVNWNLKDENITTSERWNLNSVHQCVEQVHKI